MDENDELKIKLQQELQWVKYRKKMLNIIDEKLLKMRGIAEQSKFGNYTVEELEKLNDKMNNLASQARAIDEESKRIQYGVVDE